MGWLYLGQDRGMRIWSDSIYVRNSGVSVWLAVSSSG
jgi:hypothetical protein